MPMPFHCVECDKPIQESFSGVCKNCKAYDVVGPQKNEEE
jgi:predicted ATP-dependent serine protease